MRLEWEASPRGLEVTKRTLLMRFSYVAWLRFVTSARMVTIGKTRKKALNWNLVTLMSLWA